MRKNLLLLSLLALGVALLAVPLIGGDGSKEDNNLARHRINREQLSAKQQERIARRKARQEAYERYIDSVVLSHNYTFTPSTFSSWPTSGPGGSHIVTNPLVEMRIGEGWADIYLPYYRGFTPPYRLDIINTSIASLNGYVAEQTQDGWHISFSSWLYSANDYTFDLHIYSASGSAQLDLSSTLYPTTSFWGSVRGN